MIYKKLILKDAIDLLIAIGYSYEGLDSGKQIYYHPNNPRQHILTIPIQFKLEDELSEEISKKVYKAIKNASGVKH